MQLKEPGFGVGYLQFNLSGGDTSTEGSWDAQSGESEVDVCSIVRLNVSFSAGYRPCPAIWRTVTPHTRG